MNATRQETETEFPRVYEVPFVIGDIVYHVCRDEPIRGMVTGFTFGTTAMVDVTWGNTLAQTEHRAIELTKEKPAP